MALALPAGLLNRRISIDARRQEMSGGQLVDEWERVFDGWAQIDPRNTRATQVPSSDGVARDIESYTFRIRYRPSINAGMRVIYQGNTFEIVGVLHDFVGHIYTDILCAFGGAQG